MSVVYAMRTDRQRPHCVIMLSEDDCTQLEPALVAAINNLQADMDCAASEGNEDFVNTWLQHRSVLNEILIAISR